MTDNGLLITDVEEQSIAEELGVKPGDRLLAINEQPVRDILDYRFLCAAEELLVKVTTQAGEVWELEIEKEYEEGLGLDFGEHSFGATRLCHNRCLFCFVDQMAPKMRETLYIKDDDYRLSFWQGNFVTLTNVKEAELQRIVDQRMGPLFISVHTTNPELRARMLNNRFAGNIMDQLSKLAKASIEMHTQVVLCPDINDGAELKRTIEDLAGLWPEVQSMAVVPVGVTKYRQGLYNLRTFTQSEASQVIDLVEGYQQEFLEQWGDSFVYASDEFYVMAGKPIPPTENYGNFPQTENGVGLARLFLDEWDSIKDDLPRRISSNHRVTLVTGTSGAAILQQVVDGLNQIKDLQVDLEVVKNQFFGESVTVTGLLTGGDIIKALKNKNLGDAVILPSVMLRDGEEVFLDDVTVSDVADKIQTPVEVVDGPENLVEVLLGTKA